MYETKVKLQWAACSLIGLIILFGLFLGNGTSLSIDLAHHKALIDKIARDGSVSGGYIDNLSEMSIYPPLAHFFAAAISPLCGSTLIAMNFVVILSFFATYSAIAWILFQVGFSAITTGVIIFPLLFGLCIKFGPSLHFLPLIGVEITGNFFYSQFVSQAFLLLITVIILSRRQTDKISYFIAALGLFISIFIHPLFALVFFCASIVFFFVEEILSAFRIQKLLILGLYITFGSVAFLLIPYSRNMAILSNNNGELGFVFFANNSNSLSWPSYGLIILSILLAIIILVFLVVIFRKSNKKNPSLLMLVSFLLSSSGLALMQIIMKMAGKGSNYAVKKYFFDIFTFLILSIIALACFLVSLRISKKKVELPLQLHSIFLPIIVLLPIVVAPFVFQHSYYNAREIFALEEKAKYARDYLLNETELHRTVCQFNINPVLEYMISICDLQHPRDNVAYKLLASKLDGSEQGLYVLANAKSIGEKSPQQLGIWGVYTSAQVFSYNFSADKNFTVQFNSSKSDILLKKGFSGSENWGTWSDGPSSLLSFAVNDLATKRMHIKLNVHGWIERGHESFNAIVRTKSETRVYQFNQNSPTAAIEFDFRHNDLVDEKNAVINFEYDNLKSPAEALGGGNADTRKLSIGLTSMEVSFYDK